MPSTSQLRTFMKLTIFDMELQAHRESAQLAADFGLPDCTRVSGISDLHTRGIDWR